MSPTTCTYFEHYNESIPRSSPVGEPENMNASGGLESSRRKFSWKNVNTTTHSRICGRTITANSYLRSGIHYRAITKKGEPLRRVSKVSDTTFTQKQSHASHDQTSDAHEFRITIQYVCDRLRCRISKWDTLAEFTQKCDASTWMLQNTSKSDRDTSTELGKQEKSGLKISEGDFFMDHERSCLRSSFSRGNAVEKRCFPVSRLH